MVSLYIRAIGAFLVLYNNRVSWSGGSQGIVSIVGFPPLVRKWATLEVVPEVLYRLGHVGAGGATQSHAAVALHIVRGEFLHFLLATIYLRLANLAWWWNRKSAVLLYNDLSVRNKVPQVENFCQIKAD